jgi:PAS domain S-box-containing protein
MPPEKSDRPQPELELLGNQSRLEAFFLQSPDGFFVMMLDRPIQWDDSVDKEAVLDYVFVHQRITKVNAAMLAQYFAAEKDFMDLTPADFFAHDLKTGRQLWREIFDRGRLHVETFEHRLDGTSMWIEGDYSCLYDSDGKIIGHFGIQRDISKRKQGEEDLKQINTALSHAVEGISRLDIQGHYQMVNQAYASAVGYQPDEMIGMEWPKTVHPDDLDRLMTAYQKMLTTGKVQVEARGVRKDGSIFYKQLTMVATYDPQQQLTGHYCFMKDVSERVQNEAQRNAAEAELRQSEQKFRAIFDSMFQFIGVLTPEGVLLEGNRTAFAAVAAERADVIGKPFWDTPWWTHSPTLQEKLKGAIAQAASGEIVRFEAEHILADGSTAIVDFSLKPIFDEVGKVIMLIPEGRDISDRKTAELELQQQKQDLIRSNDELQQFAYVASHDLQEPLRMITSYLELLERRYKGQLDAKADRFIAYAVDGAARMQILIDDLLKYSRVGVRSYTLEQVNCAVVLQHVLRNLQVAIAESNAIITHDALPEVNADITQLTQLFQNLIGNAIKFRRADPLKIQIGVERTNDKWLFSVQDNGIGIESQYCDRIFVIFQRLHNRTDYPGTGMGLAICKKIVERHGGTLWVESTPTKGSTFYFTLPVIGVCTS